MIGMKNRILTQDPTKLERVRSRKHHVAYALDRAGVKLDEYSAPAFLDLALEHYHLEGNGPEWIAQMLREMAGAVELFHTKPEGKPS